MSDSKSSASGGIGFGGLLAIVFITLKLTHYIDWQWKWVLAPLWLPIAIALAVLAVVAVAWVIVLSVETYGSRTRKRSA